VADGVAGANPENGAGGDDPSRRDFIHIAAGAAAAGAAVTIAWPLVDQMNPAGDTLALASVEFDLTKVELGQSVTIKWRGKPLFIRHRTGAEIAAAIKAEWLVLIGTCTHLGCVPTFGGGDYQGWFCPCHGSHYDTSGRIRKGPAPTNLAVPEYAFVSDTMVKVG
jgi:ubiquinol-cytochrome c reductase iron-sulfur subunit